MKILDFPDRMKPPSFLLQLDSAMKMDSGAPTVLRVMDKLYDSKFWRTMAGSGNKMLRAIVREALKTEERTIREFTMNFSDKSQLGIEEFTDRFNLLLLAAKADGLVEKELTLWDISWENRTEEDNRVKYAV